MKKKHSHVSLNKVKRKEIKRKNVNIKRIKKYFIIQRKFQRIIKKSIKISIIICLLLIYYYIQYMFLVDLQNFYQSPIVLDINNLNKTKYFFRNLTQVIDNVTLVSAYFRIPSKHSVSDYNRWVYNFLKINHTMVFFVDSSCYEEIIYKRPLEYRNKTIWIKTDITDFYSYKNYYKEFSETYKIDIEKNIHSVPLYLVWAEKVNFLKIAIEKNYFKSMCFYWIDAGCFRGPGDVQNYINDWPSPEKCFEDGRVYMSEVLKHSKSFYTRYTNFDIPTHMAMQRSLSVDGSSFGGRKEYVLRFRELYYEVLKKFIEHKIFIGKDQNLFSYIAFNNPQVVKLVYFRFFFNLKTIFLKKK